MNLHYALHVQSYDRSYDSLSLILFIHQYLSRYFNR